MSLAKTLPWLFAIAPRTVAVGGPSITIAIQTDRRDAHCPVSISRPRRLTVPVFRCDPGAVKLVMSYFDLGGP